MQQANNRRYPPHGPYCPGLGRGLWNASLSIREAVILLLPANEAVPHLVARRLGLDATGSRSDAGSPVPSELIVRPASTIISFWVMRLA